MSIKRAILQVGIMDDRDDIASVSNALGCPPQQARRVLEELERRGLVVKTVNARQWDTTPLGHKLAFYWHPPRKFTPAIERESEGGINIGCECVPCSIWRSTSDHEEMFEEAELDVGVHVEYDGDRLIEINIMQPDDYQGERSGSGLTALSVYVSAADAKSFAAGLQKAIDHSEAETSRRAAMRERQLRRAAAKTLKPKKKSGVPKTAKTAMHPGDGHRGRDEVAPRRPEKTRSNASGPAQAPAPRKVVPVKASAGSATLVIKADPDASVDDADTRKRSREAVSASIKVLREANRARRRGTAGPPASKRG